jgi:hypothetical protein
MSRFFAPDDAVRFVYLASGQVSQAKPGDFLKCHSCKRYQKIEQALSLKPRFAFVCSKCRQANIA